MQPDTVSLTRLQRACCLIHRDKASLGAASRMLRIPEADLRRSMKSYLVSLILALDPAASPDFLSAPPAPENPAPRRRSAPKAEKAGILDVSSLNLADGVVAEPCDASIAISRFFVPENRRSGKTLIFNSYEARAEFLHRCIDKGEKPRQIAAEYGISGAQASQCVQNWLCKRPSERAKGVESAPLADCGDDLDDHKRQGRKTSPVQRPGVPTPQDPQSSLTSPQDMPPLGGDVPPRAVPNRPEEAPILQVPVTGVFAGYRFEDDPRAAKPERRFNGSKSLMRSSGVSSYGDS